MTRHGKKVLLGGPSLCMELVWENKVLEKYLKPVYFISNRHSETMVNKCQKTSYAVNGVLILFVWETDDER